MSNLKPKNTSQLSGSVFCMKDNHNLLEVEEGKPC